MQSANRAGLHAGLLNPSHPPKQPRPEKNGASLHRLSDLRPPPAPDRPFQKACMYRPPHLVRVQRRLQAVLPLPVARQPRHGDGVAAQGAPLRRLLSLTTGRRTRLAARAFCADNLRTGDGSTQRQSGCCPRWVGSCLDRPRGRGGGGWGGGCCRCGLGRTALTLLVPSGCRCCSKAADKTMTTRFELRVWDVDGRSTPGGGAYGGSGARLARLPDEPRPGRRALRLQEGFSNLLACGSFGVRAFLPLRRTAYRPPPQRVLKYTFWRGGRRCQTSAGGVDAWRGAAWLGCAGDPGGLLTRKRGGPPRYAPHELGLFTPVAPTLQGFTERAGCTYASGRKG
eukprot:363221-Chlamydomonas_euryale.AAC.25